MLFVHLNILPKLEMAMLLEIQLLPCYDGAWAQFIPEITVRWQTVQPEHACLAISTTNLAGTLWNGRVL